MIARVLTRIFLGEELCRNEAWLRTTIGYTLSFFIAATYLRIVPDIGPLRLIASWFLPQCRELRKQYREAWRIMEPVIAKRCAAGASAGSADADQGGEKFHHHDAIDLADQEAAAQGIRFNPLTLQLMLAVAAIHTMADLCTQFILDLAAHPAHFLALRAEVVRVLRAEGKWTRSALAGMKLLDSALKESQRRKPPGVASMRRRVEADMTLSTGLRLKVGDSIMIDTYRMGDPALHANPEVWDPYRFLRMRQGNGDGEKRENADALLTTPSPDHLAFGYGALACLGRFFAANEIKIIVAHLLVKYEWELSPGTSIKPFTIGFGSGASPQARIRVRRREAELDLDAL